MDITRTYARSETDSLDDIEAQLEGQIFHVTKLTYLPSIIESGGIRANGDGRLSPTFGNSDNGFFRKRNCVSLFDYREQPPPNAIPFRARCDPFRYAYPPNGAIAILILKPEVANNMIPWTKWHEERSRDEMIVPHVEAGFPGLLPLCLVLEIISVEITEDPQSHLALMREVHDRAGKK